jgi:hypothetical protein
MPLGQPLSTTLPTVGGDADTWGTELNERLTEVQDVLEAMVGVASVEIDGDLSWNAYEQHDVGAVQLSNLTGTLTGATNVRKLYVANGDWYVNDGSGNVVRLTSGGALDVTSAGGIGGDYGGGNPAQFVYTDASNKFVATTDPGISADIDVGSVIIRERVSSANGITIASPSSLAAAYGITLPGGLPASTSVTTMSSGGQMAFTRSLTIDTVTATGTVTATDHRHTTAQVHQLGPAHMVSTTWALAVTGTPSWDKATSGGDLYIEVPVRQGDRITAASVFLQQATANSLVTCQLIRMDMTSETEVTKSTAVASAAVAARFAVALTSVTVEAVAANYRWYIKVTHSATASLARVLGAEVSITRP